MREIVDQLLKGKYYYAERNLDFSTPRVEFSLFAGEVVEGTFTIFAPEDRPVISAAKVKAETTGEPAAAIELADGRIVTGRTSELLGASSAMLLNALKAMAGIPDETLLIIPEAINPIQSLKVNYLGSKNPRLHTDEVLVALSISAATDENAKKALLQLSNLRGLDVHSSVILSQVDMNIFRKLGVNLTTEPVDQTNSLYHN